MYSVKDPRTRGHLMPITKQGKNTTVEASQSLPQNCDWTRGLNSSTEHTLGALASSLTNSNSDWYPGKWGEHIKIDGPGIVQ